MNRIKGRDFEWVIVDNGSTDHTAKVVASWLDNSNFAIVYLSFPTNLGLAGGVNEGIKVISGEFTIVIDDDDILFDSVLDTIDRYVQDYQIHRLPSVAGIAFRSLDEFGKTIGKAMPKSVMFSNRMEMHYLHGIDSSAEIFNILKTDVRKKYKFIQLQPPDRAPNSITLNQIAKSYKMLYVDVPLRVMYRHDGIPRLSNHTSHFKKFPMGKYLQSLSVLNSEINYFWHSPKYFVHHARKLSRFGLHNGKNLYRQSSELTSRWSRILWLVVGIIPGSAKYYFDLLQMRKKRVFVET